MGKRTEQKTLFSSLTRFEQLALFSSILIWAGAIVFGIGLTIALCNVRTTQIAYAKVAGDTATILEDVTARLTPTTHLYPAGWSTATPTLIPGPTQTPRLAATPVADDPPPTATPVVTTPTSSPTPSPTPTETPAPLLDPPDRLVIPSINLDSPVVPIGWVTVEQSGGTSRVWNVVDNVVGWHNTSTLPGNVGNVVLNGHHNIRGEVFRYLVDVKEGDQVILYAQDKVYYYAVTEKQILKEKGEPMEVRQQNARWIGPTEDERLTMITCWPYTNNTHRLIVVAKPIPDPNLVGLEGLQKP
jgi:sortase A